MPLAQLWLRLGPLLLYFKKIKHESLPQGSLSRELLAHTGSSLLTGASRPVPLCLPSLLSPSSELCFCLQLLCCYRIASPLYNFMF